MVHTSVSRVIDHVAAIVIGKRDVVKMAVAALLARGHVLIEDVPGLGKTTLARALAGAIDADFKRIQFTPDLLPADVTGSSIWNPRDGGFEFVRGPLFTEVLLGDEINRSSPRTQSALLEAMEERQVTVDGTSYPLREPFFVIATQNPIELAGTYPLPEAQIDRFLVRLELGYPEPADEVRILEAHGGHAEATEPRAVIDRSELVAKQRQATQVAVSEAIKRYVVAIAGRTRAHQEIRLGLSPRGSLALLRMAKAWAFIDGRGHVTPDDVKTVAPAVCVHRLAVDPHRELTSKGKEALIREVLDSVPVPVERHVQDTRVQG